MDTHRIKVKLGDAEFDAEGDPKAIQAQYEAWLAVVSALPKAPAPPATPPAASIPPAAPVSNGGPPTELGRGLLERVFRQGDYLSLAALPRGDNAVGDAMLALLYGYLKLSGEQTVTGTSIMKSARISGVPVIRVDREMNGMTDFVLAAGVKKARRYQLNNRGITRAEEIIRAILQ